MNEYKFKLAGERIQAPNVIARAQWNPQSIWESRIIALVASKIRETDSDFFTYRISISEITGVPGRHPDGRTYQEIFKSIRRLGRAVIRIQGKKPNTFLQYTIFAMWGHEDGHFIAEFHPDLKPYFLHLKSQLTAYNLFEYLTLPSTYSQRIFEILKARSRSSDVTITLAELHEMLNTPASCRSDFAQFRLRVLEKAHQDILAHTSLRFTWEPIKQGRGIVAVKFIFAPARPKAATRAKKENSKEEQRRKANNKAALEGLQCAEDKKGICVQQDNKRIICKICISLDFCSKIRKNAH